ncbi:SET domain-containing protein 4 isoform X2 [Antechinus flavipes]|nr:SET domain-containing protein 4 isoform X2 [Antechinus flavipes]XP_051840853.1 SET domain-containing protein 4 isoform X2 [Antechinus flavipes]XP_051840854.1 SET domain-containing protein 4 isoform X2 [Antechinus flavipes]
MRQLYGNYIHNMKKKGRGRTSRQRRRKFRTSESSKVSESHKLEFIELRKWLKERKFEDHNLRPTRFSGTGRGLMAVKSLQPGELIISLPEECLLTTDTVIKSYLGDYITKWTPPISPLLALCTFLISENNAGNKSPWKPYLDILPKDYTCLVCLEPRVVRLLPKPLKIKAQEQKAQVQELFVSSRGFFSSLQSLYTENVEHIFHYHAFLWAWCTINTRTVYMKHAQKKCLSAEPDVYALAPYLDLLNHSPGVQVNAAFNEKTRCYEIRTTSSYKKYEELFICYGPHDNHRLLLEYGFVAINNPHSAVYVSIDSLVDHLPSMDTQMNKKLSLLKEHGFSDLFWLVSSSGLPFGEVITRVMLASNPVQFLTFSMNLTFGWDGPSWRLLTALKLLCLGADEFTCWKKVLLGEVISDTNEWKSLVLSRKICSSFIEETKTALQKISHMKDEETALKDQLTLVENLWVEELTLLQVSADILKNMHQETT